MILFREESFTEALLEEVASLTEDHWDEVANFKDTIKLAVDNEKYISLGLKKSCRLYTMRDDDRLVGYMSVLVDTHLHYKNDLFAFVDTIFIDIDYRKGASALYFMKLVENQMKLLDVKVMSYHIKVKADYPAIFKRLKFEKVEHIYSKLLGE